MTRYLLTRLLDMPAALFVVSLVTFLIIHLVPGDPVTIMLGPLSTPEIVRELTRYYGLDRPLPEQYVGWLGHVLQGDLGRSIQTSQPVVTVIVDRLPWTAALALASLLLAVLVSLTAVLIAAVNRNKPVDHVIAGATLLAFSVPNFVLGILLILVFGVGLRWLPVGINPSSSDPWFTIRSFIMPTVALGSYYVAILARHWRSSVLDVLSRDYVRTARAKGLSDGTVLRRHVLKNGVIPIITIIAISFGYLIGGTIVVEQVFAIPGIGTLLLESTVTRDFPVLQGVTLFLALVVTAASLLADLLYAWVDPRIRFR